MVWLPLCRPRDVQVIHSPETSHFDLMRQPMDEWGSRILFDDLNTPEYRVWRTLYAFRMYGESLRQFRLGEGPVRAMRDLLARCRREHIPVALVRMPITKEFNGMIPAEGQAALEKLFAELSEGVHVIDASEWLASEDFDDGHHAASSPARTNSPRE